MSNLKLYSESIYTNGGREWPFFDCYGLVRHEFHFIHGVWLPRYDGLDANDNAAKSRIHAELIASSLIPCEPKHGAIIAAVGVRVCHHVGIINQIGDQLYAIETDEQTGFRVVSIEQFKDDHGTVKFYAPA